MPQACNGGSILTNLAVLIADIKTYLTNGTGNPTPANTSLYDALTWQQQPDAVLSQANPVSGTLYTVLATNTNVRIISIESDIAWGITQPTLLEVLVTIDGQAINFNVANPLSTTAYEALTAVNNAENTQSLSSFGASISRYRSFLLEGRSVKIEARLTWAITQPTSLKCRVKWAKR